MSSTMTPHFPLEICRLIFGYVPVWHLHRLRSVCHDFKDMADEAFKNWYDPRFPHREASWQALARDLYCWKETGQVEISAGEAITRLIEYNPPHQVILSLNHGDHTVEYFEALATACIIHHRPTDAFKAFIQMGQSNEKTRCGHTTLHFAAAAGEVKLIQKLLAEKCDVNVKDEHGLTPIQFAAQEGQAKVVQLLLETGMVDPNAGIPLHLAISEKHLDVVKVLLNHPQIDPNVKDIFGQTALHKATYYYDDPAVAELLLATGQVDPNEKDESGESAFDLAVGTSPALVQLLLKKGNADPNVKDLYGSTMLHRAIERREHAVARLLLNTGGVDPNVTDRYGVTALDLALQQGDHAIIRCLLQAGANLSAENAILLTVLLPNGALGFNIDGTNELGETLLHLAARRGSVAVIGELLKANANCNAQCHNGWTPLHVAARQGRKVIVEMLLNIGHADPSVKNNKGKTPLDLAREDELLRIP